MWSTMQNYLSSLRARLLVFHLLSCFDFTCSNVVLWFLLCSVFIFWHISLGSGMSVSWCVSFWLTIFCIRFIDMRFELLYSELLMSENIGIPRPSKRTGNDSNFRSADEVYGSLMVGINFVSMMWSRFLLNVRCCYLHERDMLIYVWTRKRKLCNLLVVRTWQWVTDIRFAGSFCQLLSGYVVFFRCHYQ